MELLRNKYFWIAVAVIILAIVIKLNWYKIKRLFQTVDITMQPGESSTIPDVKKVAIKTLARAIYDDLNGHWYDSANLVLYGQALGLTDNELLFLSQYYRTYITKDKWLYQAIDEANVIKFTGVDLDTQLMARLSKIGEKA